MDKRRVVAGIFQVDGQGDWLMRRQAGGERGINRFGHTVSHLHQVRREHATHVVMPFGLVATT